MKARDPAWKPPHYELADIIAIRALQAGTANEDQQRRAFTWIMDGACGFRDEPFRSDKDGGQRDTDFHLGRHFVARQITYLLTMPSNLMEQLRKKTNG